jgi:hypothetical protein
VWQQCNNSKQSHECKRRHKRVNEGMCLKTDDLMLMGCNKVMYAGMNTLWDCKYTQIEYFSLYRLAIPRVSSHKTTQFCLHVCLTLLWGRLWFSIRVSACNKLLYAVMYTLLYEYTQTERFSRYRLACAVYTRRHNSVTTVWQQCDNSVTTVWQQCNNSVTRVWQQCNNSVTTV